MLLCFILILILIMEIIRFKVFYDFCKLFSEKIKEAELNFVIADKDQT